MRSLTLYFALLFSLVAVRPSQAQTPANKEPHHKQLIYTNFLRAFDVVLAPGEATGDHVHEFDVATLALGDGTIQVRRGGQTEAPVSLSKGTITISQFSGAPAVTLTVTNTGSTPVHLIEVENVREDGKFPTFPPMAASGVTLATSDRGFAVYDIKLAGGMMSQHTHEKAFLIIELDGVVENGGIGGEEPRQIRQTGEWIAMPAAAGHYLAAPSGDMHAIEIEVR